MAITRLGNSGHGAQRTGSFGGRGDHYLVGQITRLGSGGYGTRRCGSFAGRTSSSTAIYGGGQRKRVNEDEEIIMMIHAMAPAVFSAMRFTRREP